ncbi:preprotein translocase subunit SecA [Patescibacteria group bacterium]|nr:preprotein translocase subunit SecA [Patescibacteria group bacterium]
MLNFVKKLFDYNEKELKRLQKITDQVNVLESEIKKLSDKDLAAKTKEFKEKIAGGVNPQELMPETFAVVREAAIRTIGQRHYDVQLVAGAAIWEGKIAEQKTGEGKTLTATLPLYLRALEGKGTHLVTVNDYLARRDSGWMGQIFNFLGLSVSCIIPYQSFLYDPEFKITADDSRLVHLKPIERKEAYLSDITYGTNNEFGFDYLRDNMARDLNEVVQREHFFAIVDEVDFALIDEARTPLIISSPESEATEKYYRFAELASELLSGSDFVIDEKARSAMLTEFGIRKVEKKLGVSNLYEEDFDTIHYIENSLKASALFQKDKDYVVKDGQVLIVDEFTGRLMHGRRWSDGLHQAVEAKEGVTIQRESKTWATITFQNYFRMYQILSGMSATSLTESEEFKKIYELEVIEVLTNKPVDRTDFPDVIYKTRRAKYAAVAAEIEDCYQRGQPVLVGTTSIENNEMVSRYLKKKGVSHQLLNAKQHEKEAGIISQAGRLKAVTVATNMAGRGVDIILGGAPPKKVKTQKSKLKSEKESLINWQEEHDQILELGGLHVIGTERHEARRIDNQLRGRSGRQGDPGSSRFFVSLEDDLMRIFGGEKIASVMSRFNMPEDMPISHAMVSRMIEQIQIKIEGFNYDIRKGLVEFDDIVNKQREIIYRQRKEILKNSSENPAWLKETVLTKLKSEIALIVDLSLDPETMAPDADKVVIAFAEVIPIEETEEREIIKNQIKGLSREVVIEKINRMVEEHYQQKEEELGSEICREIERSVLLYTLDNLWVDHLTALESLKQGVRLRGYGQRDPLVEYRTESFAMFKQLLARIDYHVVRRLFRVEVVKTPQSIPGSVIEGRGQMIVPQTTGNSDQPSEPVIAQPEVKPIVSGGLKPGRNDPCPCGATKSDGTPKKYKQCCYPEFG